MTQNRLDGRTALVTGATRGIGEAIARRLARDGARVVVHGRDEGRCALIAGEIGGESVTADLSDPTAPRAIASALEGRRLDCLVNNAGYEVGATVQELTSADLRALLEVNLIAPVELMRLLVPALLRAPSPSIINVTSIHESVPVKGNGGYAAAKAALASLSRTAAVEFGPLGIRVNTLAPGAIRTEMNAELIQEIGNERFEGWIPLGRVGSADEVADVAAFLASDDSRYVSGSSVVVDGAYTSHLVRYEQEHRE